MEAIPLITLTTDFGAADGYVGTMKGVILTIAPTARLVDISHHIAPQNVRQAAYVLYTAYPFFPPHTVHLVVVDPGVGSARRAIAVRTPAGAFVGPDNGVLSYVMANENEPVEAIVELTNPRYQLPRVSHTFHGRDLFAPAAAHLAAGVPIAALGPPVHDPVTLPLPRLDVSHESISGAVLHADRFGNIVTSIGRLSWNEDALALDPAFRGAGGGERTQFEASRATVVAGKEKLDSIHRTYAQVEPGAILALVGSDGYLEIAVREGSAADRLGLQPGDPITVRIR